MSLAQTKEKSIELLRKTAIELGFNDVRFLRAQPLIEAENKFLQWREQGYAADMHYLLRDDPVNARPQALLAEAKTIIMLTASYYSPAPAKPGPDWGRVSTYAVGLDYHKVLRKKIKALIEHPDLAEIFARSRFFTDAVPLLEKSFAARSGLGFQGRNTLLLSRDTGSFNFILEIITDIDLVGEEEASKHLSAQQCGACTRCIEICPTEALIMDGDTNKQGNGILDARKCISYLTIENRGLIEDSLASKMGEWLFGCDLCQTICPYNQKDLPKIFDEFKPEAGVGHWIYLPDILKIKTDDEFYKRFGTTPLSRAKRVGLIRNAIIVAANQRSEESFDLIKELSHNEEQIIQKTASWALRAY